MTALNLPLGGEYCTAIDEHDGIRIGDRITFSSDRHDHATGRRRTIVLTGTVRAMYLEKHPNTLTWRPDGAVFAEVDLDDGGEERCWFVRDKPALAREIDGAVGPAPEGAMF